MPAVLRISGPFEQLRQSMLEVPFPCAEAIASRKKRERGESGEDDTSTFNLTISESDGDCVPAQIEEASLFLAQNMVAMKRIRQLPGVESLCVDFSWDFPSTSIGQYNRFPYSFNELCGTLGIDIKVSVYAVYAVSECATPDEPKRD